MISFFATLVCAVSMALSMGVHVDSYRSAPSVSSQSAPAQLGDPGQR